jgi:tripartite-type tricarboxylate transporter receptor subunit TctC
MVKAARSSCTRAALVVVCACGPQVVGAATPAGEERSYPVKPLRFVVPYAPGGGTDIVGRLVGARLTEAWGQPVVIDNRPGGGTVIGTEVVARTPPDGYTVLLSTGTHTVNASLYPKLPFDPVRDFEAVSLIAVAPNVLVVHPSVPVRSVRELLALARQRPGQLGYASSGNGGTGHLAMEMLKQMAAIDVIHVPYKGAGPAVNAILSGEVGASINNMIALVPQIRAGRIRALGVTTTTRSAILPDVPTIAESGLAGFEASGWFGAWVPAKTPVAIVNRLSAEIGRIVRSPEAGEHLKAQGAAPIGSRPDEFARTIVADIAKWRQVLKTTRIAPD